MSIERILGELRAERDRLDRAIAALDSSGGKARNGRRTNGRRRRHMSADARRRISEMMKKRWAQRKKASKAA
jgi:hypothetical protein